MNHFRTHRISTFIPRLLTLSLLSRLIVACTSSGSEPQPDADFAGSYQGKMTMTTKSGSQTFTQTVDKLTVEIKTSSSAGALTVQFFDDRFGEISDPLKATTKSNTLSIPKQTTPGYPDDVYEGSGTLSGKTLSLTLNDTFNGTTQVQTVTATKP